MILINSKIPFRCKGEGFYFFSSLGGRGNKALRDSLICLSGINIQEFNFDDVVLSPEVSILSMRFQLIRICATDLLYRVKLTKQPLVLLWLRRFLRLPA